MIGAFMVRVVTGRASGSSPVFSGKILRTDGTRRGLRAKRPTLELHSVPRSEFRVLRTWFRVSSSELQTELRFFTEGRRGRRGYEFPADHADKRGSDVI